MSMTAVDRLNAALSGRYRIESELGEGGMATVYLADDVKHERKVALKVLKPELAAVVGAERFLAEIKTTANLQHPHILPLFDSGEADSYLFYVMPYVDGETLRDKLERDHQLPVDEAVRIATNIAEALDYAHSQGVIHRDIKPANILLQAGKPVVSDFGIALAVGTAGQGRLTETGLSMGTPHYMSPEQATGDMSVGAATDTYALGAVLYEMLVGEPPYTGSTAQAILGKIIAGELASATKQRGSVAANLDAAIRKALEKVPADRFTSAGEFASALADPGFRHGETEVAGVAAGGASWNRRSIGTTALTVLLGVAAAWGWMRPRPMPMSPAPLRATLLFPTDSGPSSEGFALSPDGTRLAFVTQPRLDGGRIWIRSLENGQRRPLAGTEQASSPAWSPDGDQIAFRVGDTEIRVVPAEGGPVVTRAEIPSGIGVPTWAQDGTIVFPAEGGIWSAPESGERASLTAPLDEPLFLGNGLVALLPDGRGFVVANQGPASGGILVGDLTANDPRVLMEDSGNPRYVDGWLISVREGEAGVFAQRFEPASKTLQGPAIPLIDDVPTPGGRAQLAISSNTFVFADRSAEAAGLAWTDGLGSPSIAVPETDQSGGWMRILSQDGSRIALGGWGLWLTDAEGSLPRRVEGAGNQAFNPRWSADAETVLYRAVDGLHMIGTNPGDSAILIVPGTSGRFRPVGWGPGGEILFIEVLADGVSELRARDAGGVGAIRTVQPGAIDAALSPDGRWLAYVSAQGSDEPQIFVRAYQGTEEVRISSDGGLEPTWSANGDELYFVTERGQAMRARLSFEAGLRVSARTELPVDVAVGRVMPHPDGRLFLDARAGALERLNVIRDWQALGGGGS